MKLILAEKKVKFFIKSLYDSYKITTPTSVQFNIIQNQGMSIFINDEMNLHELEIQALL